MRIAAKWLSVVLCSVLLMPVECAFSEGIFIGAGLDNTRSLPSEFLSGKLTGEGRLARGVFLDLEGKEKGALEDFRGKVLIVVFWEYWSLDSITLLKCLQRVKEYFDSNDMGDEVVVLPISSNSDDGSLIKEVRAANDISLETYLDKEANLYDFFNIQAVPQTLVINKRGTISYSIKGYMKWDNAGIVRELVSLAHGSE